MFFSKVLNQWGRHWDPQANILENLLVPQIGVETLAFFVLSPRIKQIHNLKAIFSYQLQGQLYGDFASGVLLVSVFGSTGGAWAVNYAVGRGLLLLPAEPFTRVCLLRPVGKNVRQLRPRAVLCYPGPNRVPCVKYLKQMQYVLGRKAIPCKYENTNKSFNPIISFTQ